MKISIGILESSQRLLDIVRRHETVSEAIKDELPKVLVIETEIILDLAVRCNWLASDGHGGLRLSRRGEEILDLSPSPQALRCQVTDFLRMTRPAWLGQVPKGRNETISVISADARYVFREAGLLDDPPDQDVVNWWDGLAAEARAERSGVLTEIGRTGERLSISFEAQRTGHHPAWVAVESNLAGYDLLSRESSSSAKPLSIEVKASSSAVASAEFHVTRNEWAVARAGGAYVFHLWLLRLPVQVAVIKPDIVDHHVSVNRGAGRWETVIIPMAVFAEHFQPVAL